MFRHRPAVGFLPETLLRDSRRNTYIITVPSEVFVTYARRAYVPEQPATVKLSCRHESRNIAVTLVTLLSMVGGALTYAILWLLR